MAENKPKPTGNQTTMLKRRGLDPNNYRVIKETWCSLYLLDVRCNKVKIIYKYTQPLSRVAQYAASKDPKLTERRDEIVMLEAQA